MTARKKFLAVFQGFMNVYSDLLQTLKGEHLLALNFQKPKGTLISASAVPHRERWIPSTRLT